MANTIELSKKFVPVIDEIYKAQAVTDVLDSQTKIDFTGTNEVKILKISTTGLGDYSRESGYPKGDVTAAWETLKLGEERGKEISVDRMNDEETLGQTFGTVVSTFMGHQVAPEVDAFRFSRYAAKGTKVTGTLTKDNILEAIDEGMKVMDGAEVPATSRYLFVNSDLKPALNGAFNRQWVNENGVNTMVQTYNGMPVIFVPKSRFFETITLNDGTFQFGFTGSGNAINFMIVEKGAVVQAKKFALPKIFDPDENQTKDAWKFQFRLYHDAFVYENKVAGIYTNVQA